MFRFSFRFGCVWKIDDYSDLVDEKCRFLIFVDFRFRKFGSSAGVVQRKSSEDGGFEVYWSERSVPEFGGRGNGQDLLEGGGPIPGGVGQEGQA